MKNTNILKGLATTFLLSQVIVPVNILKAEEKTTQATSYEKKEEKRSSNLGHGLIGHYFNDQLFHKPVLIDTKQNGDLRIFNKDVKNLLSPENQQIRSARWDAIIKPTESGEYSFSTSLDKDVILKIDDTIHIDQSVSQQKIKLEKNKTYKLQIEYSTEKPDASDVLINMQLFWTKDDKKEIVPEKNLLLPNAPETEKQNSPNSQVGLFATKSPEKFKAEDDDSEEDELKDTDNDHIYDTWEINGYTVKDRLLVKWDEKYKELGYKKYVSNPYRAHTVGDPYNDFEKAAGQMDKAIKSEARDPLVAAYPVVGVDMEKLIWSKNADTTNESGETHSHSNSTSHADTITNGVDVSLGFQGFQATGQVSYHFSKSNTTTTSTEDTNGKTVSSALHMNQGESAFLNANVRYFNTGSAPIYNVKPTTNFVLGDETLATIAAQPNQIGNTLKPGETYPQKDQAPLALNTLDQFSSKLIPINFNQLKKIEDNHEPIRLETTQVSGDYLTVDDDGKSQIKDNDWTLYNTQVESVSGTIILNTDNETLERYVAAKNPDDPEDRTPELTVGEAIQKAFNAEYKGDYLYYKDVPIDESTVQIIWDKDTDVETKKQMDKTKDYNFYNVKLRPGMKIAINKPVYLYDFDNHNAGHWYYTKTISLTGLKKSTAAFISPNTGPALTTIENLKPYTEYALEMYVKSDHNPMKMKLKAGDTEQEFNIDKDYQKIRMYFTTDNETSKNIQVINNGKENLLFDNVIVGKIKFRADLIFEHDMEKIKASHQLHSFIIEDNGFINGMYFKINKQSVVNTIEGYRVVVGGKNYGSRGRYAITKDNLMKINFLDYNAGRGFSKYLIEIYAVTNSGKETLVYHGVPNI
ncbi:binary toxin-like calcium binding domain-containing protein [Bacillus pretiosus]|uniref:PA14 domain-containing protein n=1 Tax=Bacillus pretiosus TaxID=2983392 RepID=A0ABT3ENX2_9BACI|nr:binary toxin-like calcium binding domain-containing protein [Bacillus pretiosus]MCW1238503.1 PA14 domain-containing protein [Bacillus pretiosus]